MIRLCMLCDVFLISQVNVQTKSVKQVKYKNSWYVINNEQLSPIITVP